MLRRAAENKNATFLCLFSVIHSGWSGHWQRLESQAGHLVLPLVRRNRPLPTTAHGNWWKGGFGESGLGKFEKWKERKNTLSLFSKSCKVEKITGRTCYCQPQPLETGRKDFSLFSLRRGDFMWFDTILNVVEEGSNPRKECSWNTYIIIPLLLWNMWGLAGCTCRTQKYQTI